MMILTSNVAHARETGIGGSDAKRIMAGDWLNLYLEKVGEKMPVDLSNNFSVQLGQWTEPLHRDWFAKMTGWEVDRGAPFYVSKTKPFMFAHLDGWIVNENTFVELKHSHERNSAVEAAKYYMPQLAHCCHVTDRKHCWISVILGNKEPDYVKVQPTSDYIDWLLECETAFWWHVENRTPPDQRFVLRPDIEDKLIDETPIGELISYDMSKSNEWADFASKWIDLKPAADAHDEVAKKLKGLVPANSREAYGQGVTVRRDKAGRLSIRRSTA